MEFTHSFRNPQRKHGRFIESTNVLHVKKHDSWAVLVSEKEKIMTIKNDY